MTARSGFLAPAARDPFRPEASEGDPTVATYTGRTAIGVAKAAWDLAPWRLVPDAAGRCWRAEADVDGLALVLRAGTVPELREAVLARRGQAVRVP